MDITEVINQYLDGSGDNKGRKPEERYSSFDYCYNYFYSFYRENKLSELANDENLQVSCLQLGFYLASWGMLRGSSFLLEKSSRNYSRLITGISKTSPRLWEIDVDKYDNKNIELLLTCKQQIANSLGEENSPTDTLITKIMLGVFANIPAFDQFFKKTFGLYRADKKSLFKIKRFYDTNRVVIDEIKIPTLEFLTREETDIFYTKAKLIDMYGFIKGQ